jgi:hypothetical protein
MKKFVATSIFVWTVLAFTAKAQEAAAATPKTSAQQSAEAKMAAQKSIAPHPIEKKAPRSVHIATPTADAIKLKPAATAQSVNKDVK